MAPPKQSKLTKLKNLHSKKESTNQLEDEPMESSGQESSSELEPGPSSATPQRPERSKSLAQRLLTPKRSYNTPPGKSEMGRKAKQAATDAFNRRTKKHKALQDYHRNKRKEDPTLNEFAQETLDDAKEANDIHQDIHEDDKTRYDIVNKVLEEGAVRDDELKSAKDDLQKIREKEAELMKEKKALHMKYQRIVKRQKVTNTAMERKINRGKFASNEYRQAKKPYTELKNRDTRLEAVRKFINILLLFFSCYTFNDFVAISRKAWPDIASSISMLNAGQTYQFMSETYTSFTKMRMMKRFLKQFGFNLFSSEGKVFKLIKNITHSTTTIVKTVFVKGKAIKFMCGRVNNLREVIEQRIKAQIQGGKLPRKLKVLRLCIGFDKGGTTTKMVLMFSNLFNRNAPRNMTLLALYEGEEYAELLTAAFGSLIDEAKKIKRIKIGDRTIRVTFRFTGDLKCLKLCLGLKAGSPNYPCLYCLQFKETDFGHYVDQVGDVREHYHFLGEKSLPGQGHEGCLSWIKPFQIVLPSLHIMMGISEKIFDHLISRILIKKHGTEPEGEKMKDIRKRYVRVDEASTELKNQQETMNKFTLIDQEICTKIFAEPSFDWIEDSDVEEWCSETTCASSNCIFKLTGIELPPRHNYGDKETPEWIQGESKMWYHSLCIGLNRNDSILCAESDDGFNPALPQQEEVLRQIKAELEYSKSRVDASKQKLSEKLSELNLPKLISDDHTVDALFKVFEKFGAYKTAFFQRFTGNHIRSLLTSAVKEEDGSSKLDKALLASHALKGFVTPGSQDYDDEFVLALQALSALAMIQNAFIADILIEKEIEQLASNIQLLKNTMTELKKVKLGHKFHLLLKHVLAVAKRDKTIGYFSEHGLEAMHAQVNNIIKRLTVRGNESRLERVVQLVNAVSVARDLYGELDPLKQKKIETGEAKYFDEGSNDESEEDEEDEEDEGDVEMEENDAETTNEKEKEREQKERRSTDPFPEDETLVEDFIEDGDIIINELVNIEL